MTLEDAREYFALDRFATEATGIVIEEVEHNYAKCSFKIEAKHLGAHNQVMGGAIYTLADFAFAVASNDREHLTVTSNSSISYLSAGKGDKLTAECKCIKDGRKLCYFQTEVFDGEGRLIALVNSTGMHVYK